MAYKQKVVLKKWAVWDTKNHVWLREAYNGQSHHEKLTDLAVYDTRKSAEEYVSWIKFWRENKRKSTGPRLGDTYKGSDFIFCHVKMTLEN